MFADFEETANELLAEFAEAHHTLKHYDDRAYPREAHHVACIARKLSEGGRSPILEADYWKAVKSETSILRPRVDIWCPPAGRKRETWIEVKLARLGSDSPRRIGALTLVRAMRDWAADVYRLTALAHQHPPQPVTCTFAVAYFGSDEWQYREPNAYEGRRLGQDADALYDALTVTGARDTRNEAMNAFVSVCRDALPECTVHSSRPIRRRGLVHGLTTIEWNQKGSWNSQYSVDWPLS